MTATQPGAVATLRLVSGPWRSEDAADVDGFADAVAIALAIERRDAKGAAVSDDYRRYHVAAAAIARHARRSGEVLGVRAAHEAVVLAEAGKGGPGRVGRAFHPPGTLAEHIDALRHVEGDAAAPFLAAAEAAQARGAGYVVTIDGAEFGRRGSAAQRFPSGSYAPRSTRGGRHARADPTG